jgi:3-methyl-2-oxobutanoate hydroxymethyltransferase
VVHDLLGLSFNQTPKFARQYANVREIIAKAAKEYCEDVRGGMFPSDGESYHAAQMAMEQKEAPVNSDGDW